MPVPSRDDDFAQPMLSVRTSREAAFAAIEEFRNTGNWLSDVLDRLFRTASLPPRERGLATELACGVVRRQATLDALLRKLVARPLDQVEPPLLTILRLGVYQIALLDGVPQHACVHETVELTKRLGRVRWSGFANGVLRGATRLITDTVDSMPSASSLPATHERFRHLNDAVFADPQADPIGYFSDAFSFPRWLTERWLKRMNVEDMFQIGWRFNTHGNVYLRINQSRTTCQTVIDKFQEASITAELVPGFPAVVLEGFTAIDRLPGYDAGWFAVQDLSAMSAASRLAPQPGQRVWDVCAAPGGKTCQLAELMSNRGTILATDVRPERLQLIEQNRERLGAEIIETRLIDEQSSNLPNGPFDAILVDVPCSNTGVLGKRPEARWRITSAGMTELNRMQERLLNLALDRLAPAGRLVYSTCSIEPEENEELVKRVVAGRRGLTVVEQESFLPGKPTDGGYQALVVRQ